jgi:hypothetical protein
MKQVDIDALLKKSLNCSNAPDPQLIQKIKSFEEETPMKKSFVRHFSGAAAAVIAAVLICTTAFAAWHFLRPSEVADRLGGQALSVAFDSERAIHINQSQTAGGFTFTLMAIVSGDDLGGFINEKERNRTFAVVSTQYADGRPLDRERWERGEYVFYVSPYIRGFRPWQVNAHTLGGGGTGGLFDGVEYMLIDTYDISKFADRGVYIGITGGGHRLPPSANGAFILDEATGAITPNPAYDGINLLFELPLDVSLADPVRAQQFIDSLLGVPDLTDEQIERLSNNGITPEEWNRR